MFPTINKIRKIFTKNTYFKVNHITENLFLKSSFDLRYKRSFSISTETENTATSSNLELVTKNDPKLKHKLQVLMLEAEVMRQEGRPVPDSSFLTVDHWKELLKLESRTGRMKYLQFLFKIEKKKENEKTVNFRNISDPYDLHFCNINRDGELIQALNKNIATLFEPSFPVNLHSASYTDVFPKEKLVYLTPHTRDVMTTYDHDAIYIIGALVDKIHHEPLTLAKAKKEGIKMQKFPLDKYLQWGSGGGKSLTLNQVISVLLDLKRTGDWNYSLRHVPKRKLFSTENIPSALPMLRKHKNQDQFRFDRQEKERKQLKRVKIKSLFNE